MEPLAVRGECNPPYRSLEITRDRAQPLAANRTQAAILALNGTAVGQRTLTVNEARPREARSSSFGTGGGDRGSSGRRY